LAKLLIWPAVTIAQDYGTWLAPLRNRPRESCSSEQQGHQISGRKHRRHLSQERQYTVKTRNTTKQTYTTSALCDNNKTGKGSTGLTPLALKFEQ
jgi:hypothetical protein